jgi:hypothetical protein
LGKCSCSSSQEILNPLHGRVHEYQLSLTSCHFNSVHKPSFFNISLLNTIPSLIACDTLSKWTLLGKILAEKNHRSSPGSKMRCTWRTLYLRAANTQHQLLHTSNAYNILQLRMKSDGSSPSILPQAEVSPENACFPTFSSSLPYSEYTGMLAISNNCFGLVDKYQTEFASNTTESKYWEVWSAGFPQHHISRLGSSGTLRSVGSYRRFGAANRSHLQGPRSVRRIFSVSLTPEDVADWPSRSV